jgi:hypothetical protein
MIITASFRKSDWKLVGPALALALARAGVNIVAIRPFKDGSGPKAKLIQVGADAALQGRKTLTPEQIANLNVLSR